MYVLSLKLLRGRLSGTCVPVTSVKEGSSLCVTRHVGGAATIWWATGASVAWAALAMWLLLLCK
jgi:hypothetical protein